MESKNKFTGIYVLGSGQLAYKCAVICRNYIQNVAVIELKVTDSTVLRKLCEKDDILYYDMSKEEITEFLLKEEGETLIVSAGNTYLFPKEVIGKHNFQIINWHNALLPKHRGRNAEVWAIYEGDDKSGVTWHYIVEAVDEGDIIAKQEIAIDEKMTAMALYKEQTLVGEGMFAEFIPRLLEGNISGKKQTVIENAKMHLSKEVPNGGFLDLQWSMEEISRFLRSMDYGSLLLMGKMYLEYQGQTFSFYKYKIKTGSEYRSERKISMSDATLEITEGFQIILLKNLQETE